MERGGSGIIVVCSRTELVVVPGPPGARRRRISFAYSPLHLFFVFFFFKVEVDADSELSAASKASFLDKVRQSNAACQAGDFDTAVKLYGEAIALDPCNHILFSNRSAALVKLGQFSRALQDASRAVELNAKWPKVRDDGTCSFAF